MASCSTPSEKTSSTEEQESVQVAADLKDTTTSLGSVAIPEQPNSSSDAKLTFIVFKNDTMKSQDATGGFGYDVMLNGRLYLHQPMIPAVQGLKTFSSEKDAKKMAEFVLLKIKNNIMPPTVSIPEIDSLGIKY